MNATPSFTYDNVTEYQGEKKMVQQNLQLTTEEINLAQTAGMAQRSVRRREQLLVLRRDLYR